MNVSLTPHLESMIRDKVASGRYGSSSEVVREALRLLDERDQRLRLQAALNAGLDDIAQGEMVAWTPDLLNEIWREGVAAARAGEVPDPDVVP